MKERLETHLARLLQGQLRERLRTGHLRERLQRRLRGPRSSTLLWSTSRLRRRRSSTRRSASRHRKPKLLDRREKHGGRKPPSRRCERAGQEVRHLRDVAILVAAILRVIVHAKHLRTSGTSGRGNTNNRETPDSQKHQVPKESRTTFPRLRVKPREITRSSSRAATQTHAAIRTPSTTLSASRLGSAR